MSKKQQMVMMNDNSIRYLKFKSAVVGENMSAVVEDLIQQDIARNQSFYEKMEQFFGNDEQSE
jgi:hypothetical protein